VEGLYLPEEDGVALEGLVRSTNGNSAGEGVDIAVIQYPRIANFDDFDPLRQETGVKVRFVREAEELGKPDAVILPGTKSTMADLEWLKGSGLAERVVALAEEGTAVAGICGGYQMLGTVIYDPEQVEGSRREMAGLGLLPVETTFEGIKATYQAKGRIGYGDGWLASLAGTAVTGYEIHMGRTISDSPWVTIEERGGTAVNVQDGAISSDQRIWGCYLHGLFANENWRRAWLRQLGHSEPSTGNVNDLMLASLDRLADVVESSLRLDLL
jgi:adenosylcobyric acid synthase